jgi:type I restriction enzyme S subunit
MSVMRDGWVETTFGEVVVLNPEAAKGLADDDQIVYVDLSSVSAESGISSDLYRGSFGAAPGRARRVIRTQDVLVSTVRPYLRGFALVPEFLDGEIASTGFAVLRANPSKILSGLVWAIVGTNNFVDYLMDRATGSSYPAVRPEDVASFDFSLPPLDEQKRIVDVVSSVDVYIDALQEQADTARNARDAVLHELLSAAGGDWTETTLGDISDTRLGKMLSATTDDGSGALHPYLRNANVRWGEVDLSDLKEMRFSQKDCEIFSLLAGDLLICEGGEPGRTALLKKDLPGIYFQKAIHRVRCKQGLEPEFLEYWMHHLTVSGLLDDFLTSTTIQHLTGEKLRQLPVLLPSMDEQRRIVNAVSSIDEVIQSTEQAVFNAKTLRSGLLSDLLSGEHEIPASYDLLLGAA